MHLEDTDPLVVRHALEAVLRRAAESPLDVQLPQVARHLSSEDRFIREAAARVVARCDAATQRRFERLVPLDDMLGQLSLLLAATLEEGRSQTEAFNQAIYVLTRADDAAQQREAVLLAQRALGGLAGADLPPAFDGYSCRDEPRPGGLTALLETMFPIGQADVDYELARLAAIIAARSPRLLERITARLRPDSDPLDDIHLLLVLARLPAGRNPAQRDRIARALIGLDAKIQARGMQQDRNWDTRISEIYDRLVDYDPSLPAAVINQEGFGAPGHALFANVCAAPCASRPPTSSRAAFVRTNATPGTPILCSYWQRRTIPCIGAW